MECQKYNCYPRPEKRKPSYFGESLIFAEEFLEFLFDRWDSWTASDLGSIVKALDFGKTLTNRFWPAAYLFVFWLVFLLQPRFYGPLAMLFLVAMLREEKYCGWNDVK